MKKIEEVLEIAIKYLNREEIDYVLIGGIAVIVYGNPRTTVSLDLVVKLDEEELNQGYLEKRCEALGVKEELREMEREVEELMGG